MRRNFDLSGINLLVWEHMQITAYNEKLARDV
jgi:hypothetical protein